MAHVKVIMVAESFPRFSRADLQNIKKLCRDNGVEEVDMEFSYVRMRL